MNKLIQALSIIGFVVVIFIGVSAIAVKLAHANTPITTCQWPNTCKA